MNRLPIGPIHTVQSDGSGNLYLSDEFNHSVFALDPRGTLRWSLCGKGSETGLFLYPRGIAYGRLRGEDGIVHCLGVADAWNRRVQFIDPYGRPIEVRRGFKGIAFGEVSDLRYLPSTTGTETHGVGRGMWLVLDRGNHRICVYDESGMELHQIGRWMPPLISRRWSLPGSFVAWENDGCRVLPEFELLDHLHFPTRFVGNSVATLHIWQPGSMELKRMLCGQLIPVPHHPENLTEWISASDWGLTGWDARTKRILLCRNDGEAFAEVAVAGTPIASDLPANEVWLQNGNRLQRLALMPRAPKREDVPPNARSASIEPTPLEESPVVYSLLRLSEALSDLANQTLKSGSAAGAHDSVSKQLQALSAESKGVEAKLRTLVYLESVTILRQKLAAMAGEDKAMDARLAADSRRQWHRLAVKLRGQRDMLRLMSDEILAASRPGSKSAAGELISDDARHLLSKFKTPLCNLLTLYYRFCDDFQPSDRLLRIIGDADDSGHPQVGVNNVSNLLGLLTAYQRMPGRVFMSNFKRPSRILFTDTGDLWIIDVGEQALYRFRDGERIRIGSDHLMDPVGLASAVDSVLVGDRATGKVWHISGDGSCSEVLHIPAEQVYCVSGAGVDGRRYVATWSPGSSRGHISILDNEWRPVGKILRAGSNSLGILLDLGIRADGSLIVVDATSAKVWVLSSEGGILAELRPEHPLPQWWSRPHSVCLGTDGSVFVSDSQYSCIRWYSPNLVEQLTFGRGILSNPTGLALRENTLLVSNAGKGEIVEFNLGSANHLALAKAGQGPFHNPI